MEHPIDVLRKRLATDVSDRLPKGVYPVPAWCADPQFFPGATGLLTELSWNDVVPGSAGVITDLPPAPVGGVMVVGNYQATLGSYKRVLAGEIGGFPTTWRVMRHLLSAVAPRETFLTNAFIGLPDLDDDRAPFPTTREYTQRCAAFLAEEIALFRPRCIVCFGVPAARMLASTTPDLAPWRPWPGYQALTERKRRVLPCSLAGAEFKAVAVQHPSAVLSHSQRTQDAQLIVNATSRCR